MDIETYLVPRSFWGWVIYLILIGAVMGAMIIYPEFEEEWEKREVRREHWEKAVLMKAVPIYFDIPLDVLLHLSIKNGYIKNGYVDKDAFHKYVSTSIRERILNEDINFTEDLKLLSGEKDEIHVDAKIDWVLVLERFGDNSRAFIAYQRYLIERFYDDFELVDGHNYYDYYEKYVDPTHPANADIFNWWTKDKGLDEEGRFQKKIAKWAAHEEAEKRERQKEYQGYLDFLDTHVWTKDLMTFTEFLKTDPDLSDDKKIYIFKARFWPERGLKYVREDLRDYVEEKNKRKEAERLEEERLAAEAAARFVGPKPKPKSELKI